MISLATKDSMSVSGTMTLDTYAGGVFDDHRVHVFLGAAEVAITSYELGVELRGGRVLRKRYLEAKKDFGDLRVDPKPLIKFVRREIRRQVCRSEKTFMRLFRETHKTGRELGVREIRKKIRKAIGVET